MLYAFNNYVILLNVDFFEKYLIESDDILRMLSIIHIVKAVIDGGRKIYRLLCRGICVG